MGGIENFENSWRTIKKVRSKTHAETINSIAMKKQLDEIQKNFEHKQENSHDGKLLF